ncbi:MAG: phosphonopyruvate decarboxylase [Candidatus Diapherotrites archaeon]|nr:phosphonopyruvate decarboxylase [Candidatus Diapherotrites archaeon]
MFSCEELFEAFRKNGLLFFTGVPDSTFKDWLAFLEAEHGKRLTNIIACNECEAIAIAAGYNLSTGRSGVVYLQNSGEGKTVNPLTSLCDPEVYSIPVLLMVGWRGEPGKVDEPEHKKMGKITLKLLEVLGIPYKILSADKEQAGKEIAEMKKIALEKSAPAAIIIRSGTLEKYSPQIKKKKGAGLAREEAIKIVAGSLGGSEAIVSTTGKISRELFEHRIAKGEKPRDFYMIGSMGCAPAIALGIALQKPKRKVIVFDGDGALLMQAGTLATIGHYKPANLYHIVFDNGSYESTGGQPSVSYTVVFGELARACCYRDSKTAETRAELEKALKEMCSKKGPCLLVVKVRACSRSDLGRPTTAPAENKKAFIEWLK